MGWPLVPLMTTVAGPMRGLKEGARSGKTCAFTVRKT